MLKTINDLCNAYGNTHYWTYENLVGIDRENDVLWFSFHNGCYRQSGVTDDIPVNAEQREVS